MYWPACRAWPCKMYSVFIMSLAVVTRTIWQLERFDSMSHHFSHINCLSVSVCSTFFIFRTSKCQAVSPATTAHTEGHWCKQKTRSVLIPKTGVPQRLRGPIQIPCHQARPSVTGSQERHGSRIVRFLSFHTGGASKGVRSDWLYKRPLNNQAVSNQFACLHSHSLQGPQPRPAVVQLLVFIYSGIQ